MRARRLLLIGLASAALAGGAAPTTTAGSGGMRVVHDVAYGPLAAERLDVYAPRVARNAPVIFMVHGGGWRHGDKAARGVVANKVARWVPRGFVVVSTNYPLLPGTPPLVQARYVADALAYAQRHAAQWGGSRTRFVLMGHSAGAHLVSFLDAEPSLPAARGAIPWLGTVSLDSAAYDITEVMERPHLALYDEAFGHDPSTWAAASPTLRLHGRIPPFLAVCSSLRADACPQARAFAAKARSSGSRAQVLPERMRHGQIDSELGLPSAYTTKVEAFLRTLSPAVARLLRRG